MKRILSLILAAALLSVSLASCSNNPEAAEETETPTAAAEEAVVPEEEPEEELKSAVPEELDFGGESLTLYYYECLPTYNIQQEEITGENVEDAIYNANQSVMDYLNCTFEYFDDPNLDITAVENSVSAGDGAYDIVYGTQWKVAPKLTRHIFRSFTGDEYIDFSRPWWYDEYMTESATGNGDIYMLAGDLNLCVLRRSSIALMNDDLLNDCGFSAADVKSSVLEGAWTLDKMYDITDAIYVDANGDGAQDFNDVFGLASWTRSDVEHLVIDAGIRATSRDENGIPLITFNNEQTVSCVEKLVRLIWENKGAYYVEGIDTAAMLEENRVGFLFVKFSNLENFRDIDRNFTIIPMPKLDETIDHYSSLVHDDVTVVCEPITTSSTELISAVIEQLSFESYRNVTPQYYDVSLKNKYMRNTEDETSRIVDMIHDSITTDFSYVYNYALGNFFLGLRDLIGVNKSADFASYYKKLEKVSNKSFEKLLKEMSEE